MFENKNRSNLIMKKKKAIFIIAIIVLIIMAGVYVLLTNINKSDLPELNDDENKIDVEENYQNFILNGDETKIILEETYQNSTLNDDEEKINVEETYQNSDFSESNYDEKKIIAEKAYKNYAWGFNYNGMAMFDDGTIYKWNFSGSYVDYNVNSNSEHIQWIIEHGNEVDEKVSEEDLNKIKQNIETLDGTIDFENTALDAGSSYIVVWNSNDKKITLREKGDLTGENNSTNTKKLIEIIETYLK
jgi:hypothetical protein